MPHGDDGRLVRGRGEGRPYGDLADAATGQFETTRQLAKVDVPGERRRVRKTESPDGFARGNVRLRELEDESQASEECFVDVATKIRCEDRKAREGLHAMQEIRDLDVRISVVGVLDLAALAEQRIRFVEEQHCAGAL